MQLSAEMNINSRLPTSKQEFYFGKIISLDDTSVAALG
jgi:hypothetical protein